MKPELLKITLEQELPRTFPDGDFSIIEAEHQPNSHLCSIKVELTVAQTSAEILEKITTVVLRDVSITHQSGDVSKLQGVLYIIGAEENAARITINGTVNDNLVQIFTILIIKPVGVVTQPKIRVPRTKKQRPKEPQT